MAVEDNTDIQFMTQKSSKWLENPPVYSSGKQRKRKRVQPKQGDSSKRGSKKRYLLLCVLLGIFLTGSLLSLLAYPHYVDMYHRDTALAQTGAEHLRMAATLLTSLAANPLDSQTVQQAQQEFTAALPAFAQVNHDLAPLPRVSSFLPVVGGRLNAAFHLVPAAIELSQAGITACDILKVLIDRLHNPLSTQQGQGLTMADYTTISQNIQRIKLAFDQAVAEINQVHPADVQFNASLARVFATFQKELPALQAGFDALDKLLPVLPTLLGIGTPANYLIEVLDSTELRPGGGFIGNYGIASFSGARLTDAHITDVDLLDAPFEVAGHRIPWPAAYSWYPFKTHGWGLRDSDFDADFPTSARNGEMLYKRERGTVPVMGVVAITPVFMAHVLTLTGPIDVPEYQETVTSQNLIARIHLHQLGGSAVGEGSDRIPSPDGHSSQRKRFTELLAEHLLARVRQLAAPGKFLQLMASSLHTKDLQLYFDSSSAEQLLQHFHLDAAIQAPAGDSLFIVNANTAGNKANSFISNTLNDQVTIDPAGNAIHHTTITYAWTLQGPIYGNPSYRDYTQVYVPSGSNLQMQAGWEPSGTNSAFGHNVFTGLFKIASFGHTTSITLTWTVPSAAKKDANGWHYRDLLQKQAGTQWKLNLQVTLPTCAAINTTSGGLVSDGKQAAAFSQSLNEDMNFGIDYNC